jgi:ABC-type antimicrobial peptide transport system permease subunit
MQILLNVIFYAFLAWLFYDSTVVERDWWFAFVVGFVIVIAIIVQLMPALHASKVSPGEFPYDTIGD